jgi:transposase-like protein
VRPVAGWPAGPAIASDVGDTQVGTIGLAIPTVRDDSYFPSLLEPWRWAERAVLSLFQ